MYMTLYIIGDHYLKSKFSFILNTTRGSITKQNKPLFANQLMRLQLLV
jgi:hypothetical protein